MTTGAGAERVTQVFDRVSAVYDTAVLQRWVYRPAQDEIISEVVRRRPHRVADVGCGTGILASRLAGETGGWLVVGLDPSEGMLGVARRRTAGGGVDRAHWLRARSEQIPVADRSLDAVVSSHAFHFFDQRAALAEFHRVLAPGGFAAVVVSTPRTPAGSGLMRAALAGAGRFPDERRMRQLFDEVGFVSVQQRRVRRGGLRALSPDLLTVGMRSGRPPDPPPPSRPRRRRWP